MNEIDYLLSLGILHRLENEYPNADMKGVYMSPLFARFIGPEVSLCLVHRKLREGKYTSFASFINDVRTIYIQSMIFLVGQPIPQWKALDFIAKQTRTRRWDNFNTVRNDLFSLEGKLNTPTFTFFKFDPVVFGEKGCYWWGKIVSDLELDMYTCAGQVYRDVYLMTRECLRRKCAQNIKHTALYIRNLIPFRREYLDMDGNLSSVYYLENVVVPEPPKNIRKKYIEWKRKFPGLTKEDFRQRYIMHRRRIFASWLASKNNPSQPYTWADMDRSIQNKLRKHKHKEELNPYSGWWMSDI